MDITWYGLSCFRLVERSQTTIVTDPFSASIGLPEPKLKGDVITVSHDGGGHNAIDMVKGYDYVLTGPGEYEIGGVFITGIPMHNTEGDNAIYNVAYLIKYPNSVSVLHLGDLSHVPDQSIIEAIGEVNVVLVPVGGGNTLRPAMAAEVIAMIEPNYIVPMHYQQDGLNLDLEPIDNFLRAMGVNRERVEETDSLRVTGSGLPEQPEIVVLTPITSE